MDYANSRSFLGARIIGYLGGILVGALAIASLIFTYVFPLSYIEFPILSERYALVSSVLTIVAFIVFVMSHRVLHWSVTELPLWLVFMVSLVVGIVWSFVADLPPQADQGIASHYAVKLIQNDINLFNDVYIQQYPFQSGYILYLALLYSIFGVENWFVVRIINSFFAAFCVMMIPAIAKVLFRIDRQSRTVDIWHCFSFPYLCSRISYMATFHRQHFVYCAVGYNLFAWK